MAATQPPDEIQQTGPQVEAAAETEAETAAEAAAGTAAQAQAEASPATSGARGRTWAHGVPAMRLQRARWRLSGRPATEVDGAAGTGAAGERGASASAAGFPPRIRLIRTVVGVILLALAWGGAMVVYLLGRAALAPLARQRLVMVLAPRIAAGLGACLMALVVATLLLVGAFALSLAVRPNDPEPTPQPAPQASVSDAEE